MAADKGKVKVEKFDGADFTFWKIQIKDYLYQKKLHQLVKEKKSDLMKECEWNFLDRITLGVILLSLYRTLLLTLQRRRQSLVL